MLSNTSSTPRLHGGNITLEMVRAPTDVRNRRTKIVCTMGPACWSEEGLATLMDAGMNVARFNFSHGSQAGHYEVLERLRKVAGAKSRNIGTFRVYLDFAGLPLLGLFDFAALLLLYLLYWYCLLDLSHTVFALM